MAGGISRGGPAVFGAVVGALVFVLVHRALPDDAYITLNYARNFAEHGHWGLLADRPSHTATSPLNVWLLAAETWVTGRPVVAVGGLVVATMAAVGWWAEGLRRELGVSRALPYLLVVLLGCSPALASSVGLETYMGVAALVAVARYAVAGRPIVAGALVGAAVLVRPDLALPAAVLAAGIARPTWRQAVGTASAAVVVALPWHLYAWFELGGFLPDTVWIKTGSAAFFAPGTLPTFVDGWLFYGGRHPAAVLLSVAPAVAGLVVAGVWLFRGKTLPGRRMALVFATAGIAHWGALAALDSQAFIWYLVPSAACLTITACLAAVALPKPSVAWSVWVGGGVLAAGCVVLLVATPRETRPIVGNWATASQYAAMGAELGQITRGQPVATVWEIGTPTYFCRCPLLDFFGDRALTDEVIRQRLARSGPITRLVARANFHYRDLTSWQQPRWRLEPGNRTDAVARWNVHNPGLDDDRWGSLYRDNKPAVPKPAPVG